MLRLNVRPGVNYQEVMMKLNKKIVAAVAVIAIVGVGMIAKGVYENSMKTHKGMAHDIFICPMHPTYSSDRQGECPICGMSLVKKKQEEMLSMSLDGGQGDHVEHKNISGYTAIKLSPEKQQLIGIRVSEVKKAPASKAIRTVGRIAYDPELYQAEEEFLQSVEAYTKAKSSGDADIEGRAEKLVASAKVKLELMGLNEELMGELEVAGMPDKSLLVSKAGEKVWMYAPIYEHDLDAVKIGQKVKVTAQTVAPGKKYEGKVRSIDPVIDPETRSVNLRAQLENPEGSLRPNVFVNAEIQVDFGDQLIIPEDAVLDSGERQIAFVGKGDGIFEPRSLKLGSKLDNGYIVLSGIDEGESVVDQATFFVDSESKLKAALSQAGGQSSGGHNH